VEIKKESEVWELINRERKKRKGVNGNIEMEEWNEFFMGLLCGVNNRVVMRRGRTRTEREEEEELGLSRREVIEAVNKLKDGKAMGQYTREGVEIWRGRSNGMDLGVLQ